MSITSEQNSRMKFPSPDKNPQTTDNSELTSFSIFCIKPPSARPRLLSPVLELLHMVANYPYGYSLTFIKQSRFDTPKAAVGYYNQLGSGMEEVNTVTMSEAPWSAPTTMTIYLQRMGIYSSRKEDVLREANACRGRKLHFFFTSGDKFSQTFDQADVRGGAIASFLHSTHAEAQTREQMALWLSVRNLTCPLL